MPSKIASETKFSPGTLLLVLAVCCGVAWLHGLWYGAIEFQGCDPLAPRHAVVQQPLPTDK